MQATALPGGVHFCSWLGLCPGTKISGGKVLSAKTKRSTNRVRQALKMAAMSLSHSDSALGAFYRRLCSRMDKPRANTVTAHKLARMVYFMLTRGEAFVDQGQQRYEEQQRERSIAALKRHSAALAKTTIGEIRPRRLDLAQEPQRRCAGARRRRAATARF